MRIAVTIGLLIYTTVLVSCQSFETQGEELEQYLRKTMAEFNVHGAVAVGVVKDGEVVLQKVVGYKNFETKEVATENTQFYIASVTKSFVGPMMLILENKGYLSLDDPLSKYLDISFPEGIDTDDVSIEDLIAHTSGISNSIVGLKTAYLGDFTKEEIIQDLENYSYPVTREFRYTNLGYILAGMIAEKVTGKPWQQLLEEEITGPLEMTNTTAYVSKVDNSSLAQPHTSIAGKITTGRFLKQDDTMHAAGGMITTISDLNKWLLMHANNKIPGDIELNTNDLDLIHSDVVGLYREQFSFDDYGYGLGWRQSDWNEFEVSMHGGGYPGYRSYCLVSREQNTGIAVLMNQSSPAIILVLEYLLNKFLSEGEMESLVSVEEQAKQLTQRFQYVKDSVFARGKTKDAIPSDISRYTGDYYNEESGSLSVSKEGNDLKVAIGHLLFNTSYLGDDAFFYYDDGDQVYGKLDFYFHNQSDNATPTSLNLSGIDFKRIKNDK